MRIRTWLAMGFGAAMGAGAVYLFDPEHGESRRREARVRARARADRELRDLAADAARQARVVVREARAGFEQSRAREDAEGPTARSSGRG